MAKVSFRFVEILIKAVFLFKTNEESVWDKSQSQSISLKPIRRRKRMNNSSNPQIIKTKDMK